MEVFLYNSTVCRLCGSENDSGTFLYSCEENNQNLSELINTYLPIKVSDDGQLPRTICPGCTIQLEATVEFLNLIINGQRVIRELYLREKDYKKTVFSTSNDSDDITEKLVYEINTTNGVYQIEHPVVLQMAGLERPKRKRGRPPKKAKSPEEIELEVVAKETEIEAKKQTNDWSVTGKRRRKTPTRFKEAVQGKELERIFKEEGVIDGDESEAEIKPDIEGEAKPAAKEPEVIGHMETSGELVVVVKGKGRGRPKGRMRPTREECLICGMKFSCVGRYMAHIAQHGPVRYRCSCGHTADTRLLHLAHQRDLEHTGHTVLPVDTQDGQENPEALKEITKTEEQSIDSQDIEIVDEMDNSGVPMASLPKLIPDEREDINSTEFVDVDNFVKDSQSDVDSVKIEEKVLEKVEELVEPGPKGKVRVKCNHCEKTFSSKQSKSLHIKAVHHGEKPYSCGECGVRFAYPRCLALHALSHRRARAHRGQAAARRYACDLCGKVLNHPSSVVYHKEAEHAGQRYVCSKCGKSFKHKQLLLRHQLVHSQLRPYSCKTCSASFKTKANLINHQLLHSGVKKFSCPICGHKFAHKTSLTLHMRWHTGSKPFSCEVCGKSFSQKGNLSEHERIHTGEKPYQCSHCPRRFTTSSQARLHARHHQPDKPFLCTHCNKRFNTRGAWLAHVRRTGAGDAVGGADAASGAPAAPPRSHWCGECGRLFSSRWALGKHQRRHTGERPFRCPHCPRAFADCSNLNKHKKQVHKQMSLLVTNENKPPSAPPALAPAPPLLALPAAEAPLDEVEERVIYVTYDVEDSEAGFHILDPEQVADVEAGSVELLGAPIILDADTLPGRAPTPPTPPTPPALHSDHMAVTDSAGNPLHFTMADGTRLAITSHDGKSLQVITQDGQTIPVEINEYAEEEDTEDSQDAVIHHVSIDKSDSNVSSPVTHYFTIA